MTCEHCGKTTTSTGPRRELLKYDRGIMRLGSAAPVAAQPLPSPVGLWRMEFCDQACLQAYTDSRRSVSQERPCDVPGWKLSALRAVSDVLPDIEHGDAMRIIDAVEASAMPFDETLSAVLFALRDARAVPHESIVAALAKVRREPTG